MLQQAKSMLVKNLESKNNNFIQSWHSHISAMWKPFKIPTPSFVGLGPKGHQVFKGAMKKTKVDLPISPHVCAPLSVWSAMVWHDEE